MKNVIVLIGSPGSGKGTQSAILKDHYGIPHISTGDMLRYEVSMNTEIGKQVKDILEQGKLVSDELMTAMLENRIKNTDCQHGFILDGYPRSLSQAKLLDNIFTKNKINKFAVIEIVVPEDIIKKRILGRYTCNKCGAIYNKYFSNPKKEKVCDVCGGASFSTRGDDNEETITKRLAIFTSQTADVLQYYGEKKMKHVVDGTLATNIITSQVFKIVDNINKQLT